MFATPVAEYRVDFRTFGSCQWATAIQPAPDWRVDGTDHLAAEAEVRRRRRGIGQRHGGQQGLRIGMHRRLKDLLHPIHLYQVAAADCLLAVNS